MYMYLYDSYIYLFLFNRNKWNNWNRTARKPMKFSDFGVPVFLFQNVSDWNWNAFVPVPVFQSGLDWNRLRAVFFARNVDPLHPVNGKADLLFATVPAEFDQDSFNTVSFRY